MRRVATVLGTLAAAGALALGLVGSATAATGTLFIQGFTYMDPHDCYSFDARRPGLVGNFTNQRVLVFDEPLCKGQPMEVLYPGQDSYYGEGFTGSVFVS